MSVIQGLKVLIGYQISFFTLSANTDFDTLHTNPWAYSCTKDTFLGKGYFFFFLINNPLIFKSNKSLNTGLT